MVYGTISLSRNNFHTYRKRLLSVCNRKLNNMKISRKHNSTNDDAFWKTWNNERDFNRWVYHWLIHRIQSELLTVQRIIRLYYRTEINSVTENITTKLVPTWSRLLERLYVRVAQYFCRINRRWLISISRSSFRDTANHNATN